MDNTNHNEAQELRELAPRLFSLKKRNCFQVPEGFFEALPGNIEDRLLGIEVAQSFGEAHVPEGYFEQLEQDILAQTVGLEKAPQPGPKGRLVSFRKVLYYGGIAAAMIAAVFVIGREVTAEECETFACLFEEVGSSEALLYEMDESELMELLESEDIYSLAADEEGYEDYLLEEASLEELMEDIDEEEFLRALESED